MAECFLTVRQGLRLANLIARRGRANDCDAAAQQAFGCALPMTPRVASGRGMDFVWCGPGQWLAVAEAAIAEAAGGIEARLAQPFAGLASIVEQSDARVLFEFGGPRARDALAKGLPIDLHPRVFGPGDVALSTATHVAIQLWQLDEQPSYLIAAPRGYADDVRQWLEESAAEFGLCISH